MGVKELLTVQIDESGDAAASYYCRLPGASQLVSSLSKQGKGEQQTSSSSRNLTLRVTSLESEERFVYVQWRGDFSHSSSPSLVLSPHLARDLRVGNHDLVQVESVSVGIVANVAVSAVRACDWTVICENVDTIESHLLQNIGVVFEDQLLHVSVPGIAMSVQLKVTAITLRDHGTRGGNGEGAPPASSSSSSNWVGRMFSLLTMEDSNTTANAVEKGVGKLANSSLITVAPYVASAPSSTHDDVVPLPVEPSLLDLSQQCVVDDICSHSEQLLKILPPFLRHTNSSYFANNIDEGREAFNSNILSQFGALPLKDDTSNEANISDDVDGLSTASAAIVLHPLFVYNVLKSYLVNENQVSFEGKLRQLESTLSQHFLIVLSPVPASTRQTANSLEPFTRSLVQTMRVSAGVRPGYVSAPYSALISLGLLPHEEASVRLIPLQRPTPLPLRVTLQPLSISLSVQGATCKEDDNEKHSLERFGLAMMAQMDSDDIIVISDGLIVPAAKPLCKESKVPAQSGEHLLLRLPGFSSSRSPGTPSTEQLNYFCISNKDVLFHFFSLVEMIPRLSLAALASKHLQLASSFYVPGTFPMPVLPAFEGVFKTIVSFFCSLLLPAAALKRVGVYALPPTSLFLLGEEGSGRTSLLRSLGHRFATSPRTLTSVRFISCTSLASKPLRSVLESLKSAFTNAMKSCPSLLILDDLDRLCSNVDDAEPGQAAMESLIVMECIQQLLADAAKLNESAHREAFKSQASESNVLKEVISVGKGLQVIGVLISASSLEALHRRLQHSLYAQQIVTLPPLRCPFNQLLILLEQNGVAFKPKLTRLQQDRFRLELFGFRVSDIIFLIRRLRILARQGSIACTDLSDLIASYAPICSDVVTNRSESTLSWSDVYGLEDVKKSIANTFQRPLLFKRLFKLIPVKMPRAILLYGPPGSGKTLLAMAAGNACGMGFSVVRGPELLDKYIGASEKAIRALFQGVKSASRPTLIFFDEFEALAPRRGRDNGGVTDRVVNQLLTYLDGVENTMRTNSGSSTSNGNDTGGEVFIIAATSRPDLIDPALLRPGRIDVHLYVGLPSLSERRAILQKTLQTDMEVSGYRLNEAMEAIISTTKASKLTSADFRSVGSMSYLAALREAEAEGVLQAGQSFELLLVSHLLRVFKAFKPSINEADLKHLEAVYSTFKGHDTFCDKQNSVDDCTASVASQKLMLK